MLKVFMNIDVNLAPSMFMLKFDHKRAGLAIRKLVANAASTEATTLGIEDIDFLPLMYPPGAQLSALFSFEVETIGYPDRKAKLTKSVVRQLKFDIIDVLADDPNGVKLDPAQPLVWIKYQDPDGPHI
ncbi:MAG: hypothetical protein JWO50_593 [Candidatus Kaiserbacteria bacterium]|nr:hypothetical protein [Candidatus Kaiserbacteria bacterium]